MNFQDVGVHIYSYQQKQTTNKDLSEEIAFIQQVAEQSCFQLIQTAEQAQHVPTLIDQKQISLFEQGLWTFSGFWHSAEIETQQYLLKESFNQLEQLGGPKWCGIGNWSSVSFRSIVPELDPNNLICFNPSIVTKTICNPKNIDLEKSDAKFVSNSLIRPSLKNKGIKNNTVHKCLCFLRQFTRNFIIIGVIELMLCIRDEFARDNNSSEKKAKSFNSI
eukprot:gb/GECH01013078.1/.p1 GENE.gb/GECH01013078.1/~~gb/GECH01013078.1/.p1  ORF type:complete len:219 (+),score=40.94 gb/GECH01013078.1/:1-657(+)